MTEPPPPASGSGSEEVVDAGVYRVVWGPVFPGGLGGTLPPNWDPECPLHRPRTFPPGRNPPNRPGIGVCVPGIWNREVLVPDRSPRLPLSGSSDPSTGASAGFRSET